jgi:hypothetical protein
MGTKTLVGMFSHHLSCAFEISCVLGLTMYNFV